jgi:hypothetical protein
LALGGEAGAARVVGSGVVVSEVVSGIADVGFDRIAEILHKRRSIQTFLRMCPRIFK